jgi:hypothetical protein
MLLDRRGTMRRFSIATVLALLASTSGCSEEPCLQPPSSPPCAGPTPAIFLHVHDAVDGGPVANPVANGFSCGSSELCIPRQPDGGTIGAGTTSIDVTAAGYGHAHVVVTVPAATPTPCSCGLDYVPQTENVVLTPL